MSKYYNVAKAVIGAIEQGNLDKYLGDIKRAINRRDRARGHATGIDRSEYGPPIEKGRADKIAGKHGRRK